MHLVNASVSCSVHMVLKKELSGSKKLGEKVGRGKAQLEQALFLHISGLIPMNLGMQMEFKRKSNTRLSDAALGTTPQRFSIM